MQRILVVLHAPIGLADVRRLFGADGVDVSETNEVAVCLVLPKASDAVVESVRAQRHVTVMLRSVLGGAAEKVAVFVASAGEGYGVDECARDWGATVVRR